MLGADYLPELTKLVPAERLPDLLGGGGRMQRGYKSVGPWRSPDPAQQREEGPAEVQAQAEAGQQDEDGARQGAQQLQEAPQVGREGVVVSISTAGDLGAPEGEGGKGKAATVEAAEAEVETSVGGKVGEVAVAAMAALTVQA